MSKISLAPNAAGTAIFTIESPGTSTNRTLTLPDDTGTIVTNSGNQAGSFTTLNTSGAVVFNDAGANVDFRVEGDTNANLLFVDASADAVGIGTGSPAARLDVSSTGNGYRYLVSDTTNDNTLGTYSDSTNIRHISVNNARSSYKQYGIQANEIIFSATNGNDSARITSGGVFLVGKTTSSITTAGVELQPGGDAYFTAPGPLHYLNRTGTDGNLVEFRKDNTTVGSIGSVAGLVSYIVLDPRVNGVGLRGGTRIIYPAVETGAATNNAVDFGDSGTRWKDIYLVNSPNVSSDQNIKQDIEELSEAEARVAVACKSLLRKYRLKDAVAKKGDDARIHVGIIAQDLKAAFEAEGLDAHRYGMFMWNEWWEKERIIPAVEGKEAVYETQTDEEGNETQVLVSKAVEAQPERTEIDTFETEEEAGENAVRKEMMAIRYEELLAFIIASI